MTKSAPRVSHYQTELQKVFANKRWIVATGIVIASINIAKELVQLGAQKVLAIGVTRGTGKIDITDDKIDIINLDATAQADMMGAIRKGEELLGNLPQWVHHRIAQFDPHKRTKVIGNIFSTHSQIGGRQLLGARPKSWHALEDKMLIDNLWDESGIERAPFEIVDIHRNTAVEIIQNIAPKYDWGMGTVWVGDNRDGWHGGAKLLRWVQTEKQARHAYDFFATKCNAIRIMPFMNGLPCSIHGWNFSEETIALRPCEMLVYRQANSSMLIYSGSSTNWKPAEKTRKQMHDTAIKVGNHLRKTVGYLGSFTIDGIVTKHGFRPTELNPRFGAALGRMSASVGGLPLYPLHICTAEGIELNYQPQHLRQLIVETVEANPLIKGMYTLEGQTIQEQKKLHLIPDQKTGWKIADDKAENTCSIQLGPAPSGALVFASIDPCFVKKGIAVASMLASLFEFAGKQWNVNIPPLLSSPDVERT